jgi:hypothetical protein
VLKVHVASVYLNLRCFRGMLQVLHTDVAKVDQDITHVEYVASILDECFKYLFKMFHLFQTYVASVLI